MNVIKYLRIDLKVMKQRLSGCNIFIFFTEKYKTENLITIDYDLILI